MMIAIDRNGTDAVMENNLPGTEYTREFFPLKIEREEGRAEKM